ncbi:hypothetical protein AB0O57_29355 [Streptomyces sp. NPDC091201]|uniref:hypothetical protein n=1 Tax=Streptomyces sp. NPDC091201 TaxID=3155190 RepID=UPI003431FFA7
MPELPAPGWSRMARERLGSRRMDPDEDCYYCGVPGCQECSDGVGVTRKVEAFFPELYAALNMDNARDFSPEEREEALRRAGWEDV